SIAIFENYKKSKPYCLAKKFLREVTRKKDFDLSSEKEKTLVLDTKVENISHLPKSKPSNSNNKNKNSWASNIEQEEKLVGKGKQKAILLTSEVNKAKSDKTCIDKQQTGRYRTCAHHS
ncbi:1962_t:CDS:2, partial [Cetraspora pellucida]